MNAELVVIGMLLAGAIRERNSAVAVAREIAAASFVLMKNEGGVLPLKKGGTLALVGPMADNTENMPGTWSVAADFSQSTSVRKGLEAAAGSEVKILYAKGSNVVQDTLLDSRISIFGKPTYFDKRDPAVMIREAVAAAMKADVVVAAMGESAEMSGECSSRSDITLPACQRDLLKALLATGKPVVMVLFTGRPLAIPWEAAHVPAILNVWFPGTEGGHAIADVLFGDYNPADAVESFDRVYRRKPAGTQLTSFSVLLAACKGDLDVLVEGAEALERITPDSRVLIAEACTHAPLTEDIGREKIPNLLRRKMDKDFGPGSGGKLRVDIVAGTDFPKDLTPYTLVIHCGSCMFNRKYMMSRLSQAQLQNVPITNYGLAIAYSLGIFERALEPFPAALDLLRAKSKRP